MYLSQSPRLIQIDPHLVKFNSANPRKHRGIELLRLKNSLEKVGMVQFPTVRELYGDFVECLDGEGRALVAQENHEEKIWVVSLGKLHDSEALMMLQAANAVRTFGFLDECQGLANLHRQGEATRSLADKFSTNQTKMANMVAVGYFPDDLLTLIREDMLQSEEHVPRWTYTLFCELLPLRQRLPGKDPFNARQHEQTLDDVYDYAEVRRALEKVIRGEIPGTVRDMHDYVTQRRLELFQASFDQTLHAQVKAKLEQAKEALEEDHAQDLEQAKQDTAEEYKEKLQRLQTEYDDLDASYQAAVRMVAKHSEQEEQIKQLQDKLQRKTQEVGQKQQDLEAQQRKMEAEASAKKRQLEEEKERQLEEGLARQRTIGHESYAQMKADLESQYARKERELQLETETNIHQIVANCVRLLNETQLSVLNLISPGVLKGTAWLQHPEMITFIAQLRTLRETLEKAEEQLLHGNVVWETERSSSNGSQAYNESLGRR